MLKEKKYNKYYSKDKYQLMKRKEKVINMKKMNVLAIFISILIALYSKICFGDTYVFITMVSFAVLSYIGVRMCKNKQELIIISIMNMWVTTYNIAYLILMRIDIINLFDVNWRMEVQLFIPFAITLIAKK